MAHCRARKGNVSAKMKVCAVHVLHVGVLSGEADLNQPAYAQCRTPVDGAWTPPDGGSSWQCKSPGDSPSGGSPPSGGASPAGDSPPAGDSSPAAPASSPASSPPPSEGSGLPGSGTFNMEGSGDSGSGGGAKTPVGRTANNIAKLSPGGSKISKQAVPAEEADDSALSKDSAPASGGSQSPMVGGCGSTSAPGGWEGIASTSVSPLSLLLNILAQSLANHYTVLRLDGLRLPMWPRSLAMGLLPGRLQRCRQPKALPRQTQRRRPTQLRLSMWWLLRALHQRL